MTHLVNDQCINCKHTTCVTVCPVDCFYEGENMLVINPDECIDCAVCIPECPENAIYQSDDKEDAWYRHNEYFSKIWHLAIQINYNYCFNPACNFFFY